MGISVGVAIAAVVVLASSFLDTVGNGIRIIGVGTAISLAIGAVRFAYERQENGRKKRAEGIKRLQPIVYEPLLKWAVHSKKEIQKRDLDEIYDCLSNPPDLSEEADYVAIVGEKLKTSVQNIGGLYETYLTLHKRTKEEYRMKIDTLIDKLGYGWHHHAVNVIFDDSQPFVVKEVPFTYTLKFVRDSAKKSKKVLLSHNAEPVKTIDCPVEFLASMQRSDDLPSIKEFTTAKDRLISQLDLFISELKEVIANGESDWRLK